MGKIIFLDVDGTLIDYNTNLPTSAALAVAKARKNGHLVYLCTGCSKAELKQRHLCPTDGLINGNGADVEAEGKVVLHQTLSLPETKEIVDWCNQRHLGFYLECNSGMYCNTDMLKQGPETIVKYSLGKGADLSSAQKGAEAFVKAFTLLQKKQLYRDDVNKISFILSSYQDYLDAKKHFAELIVNTWGGKGEEALFGDLSPKGITKKHAIDVLLQYLHRDVKDTIAFGDAKIDISMFELCDYSVAMGNAGDECKAAADYITTDVNDNGLANAFTYLKLI